MILNEFLVHIREKGCIDQPLEGSNLTGMALRIINPKLKTSHILQLYKGAEVSQKTITIVCDKLGIGYPI